MVTKASFFCMRDRKRQSMTSGKAMKETILTCESRGTEGVVSMYSTRFWARQCRALTMSSAVTMARNATEKFWWKMVTTKRISTTSRQDCSLRRSTSASRSM
jgi:hypothetical protein